MPLNPLIALQVQPVQIQQGDLLDRQLKLLQIEGARGQQGLRALQMRELERQLHEQRAMQEYLRSGGAYVGGGPGTPTPGTPPVSAPVPPIAGPIQESGGYMSQAPLESQAQVPVPQGSAMPILPEGGAPAAPQAPTPPQRRQLKPLTELATDFYARFPTIAGGMVKQFDEAIKTEQQSQKVFSDSLKSQAEAAKTVVEAKQKHLELMTSVLNGMSQNPEKFSEGVAALQELGVPDGLLRMIGPTYNAGNIDKLRMMGADQKTLLEKRSKEIDQMLKQRELGIDQQKADILGGQLGLEREREARLGSEVILADTGTEQIPIQRYGGGRVAIGGGPGGEGGVSSLPSAKEAQVMAGARTEMAKEAVSLGEGSKKVLSTLDQMESLYREGVYSNSPATKIALTYYDQVGSAPPGYDGEKLARTRQILNVSNQLTLTGLNGSSLARTTDKDTAIVARAMGNFGTLQSPEQTELSFKEVRELAQLRAKQADEAIQKAKSGKLGGYEAETTAPRPQAQTQGRPARSSAPIALSPTEYQRGVAKAKQAGYSQEEYDAFLAKQGLQVPR